MQTSFFSKIILRTAALMFFAVSSAPAEPAVESDAPVWREEFESMPAGWDVKTKPRVKSAEFSVQKDRSAGLDLLNMRADNASGTLMVTLKKIDLEKNPILRWRWRVTTFPTGADGRESAKDDQAIGLYVSYGGMLRQRSVAYRWETETPVGDEGTAKYAAGVMQVKWICLRNKNDGDGKTFFIEERNIAEDLKKAFGEVPKEFGIGISCNSQYTGTTAEAQLDWIELRSGPLPGEAGRESSEETKN